VDFLDTNVIVYANDPRDRKKQMACANIVAEAEEAGCSRIISEDMNAGQVYCGMRMVNPFMASPREKEEF
jgi:predicted nucleic acid-binding protein